METTDTGAALAQIKADFEETGFALVQGLLAADEVARLNGVFMTIHDEGVPGHYRALPPEEAGDDVLKAYPRVMNPHRFSQPVRDYLVDRRITDILTALYAEEPIAAQSMYYYKPPGARGQAMHQDQFYLQVQPGTCIACWIAMDTCDMHNGGMIVVPQTQGLAIDCSKVGKKGSYEAGAQPIRIPVGRRGYTPTMQPGDALFFNGSLLHGSSANKTRDRWRRSLIFHYAPKSCTTISQFYQPLVDIRGADVGRGATTDGGPCGGFVGAAH